MTKNLSKKLLPYQLDIIKDKHLCILIEKSRQLGASWTLALKATLYSGIDGKGNTYFATKSKSLAQQFISDAAYWAKYCQLSDSDYSRRNSDIIIDDRRINTYNLTFKNEYTITALSSDPDAMRGWRGFKIVDEFAIHKQQKEMLDSLLPSTMWLNPIVICSTHKGLNSEFNKLVTKFKKGELGTDWNLQTIPIQRAVDEGLLDKIYKRPTSAEERAVWLKAKEKEEGPKRWAQEYCCIPEDEEGAFFTHDLIDKAERDDILLMPFKKFSGEQKGEALQYFRKLFELLQPLPGSLYAGLDVGRDVNYSVLSVIQNLSGIKITRAIVAFDRMPFELQQELVSMILSVFSLRRICVDNRGIGRETSERLQKKFGQFRVEAINQTLALKEQMVYAVYKGMEDSVFLIPKHDTIRADFHCIRKEVSSAGTPRYISDENETDPNSHADFFWSLAYANYAAGKTAPPLDSILTENPGREPDIYNRINDLTDGPNFRLQR